MRRGIRRLLSALGAVRWLWWIGAFAYLLLLGLLSLDAFAGAPQVDHSHLRSPAPPQIALGIALAAVAFLGCALGIVNVRHRPLPFALAAAIAEMLLVTYIPFPDDEWVGSEWRFAWGIALSVGAVVAWRAQATARRFPRLWGLPSVPLRLSPSAAALGLLEPKSWEPLEPPSLFDEPTSPLTDAERAAERGWTRRETLASLFSALLAITVGMVQRSLVSEQSREEQERLEFAELPAPDATIEQFVATWNGGSIDAVVDLWPAERREQGREWLLRRSTERDWSAGLPRIAAHRITDRSVALEKLFVECELPTGHLSATFALEGRTWQLESLRFKGR